MNSYTRSDCLSPDLGKNHLPCLPPLSGLLLLSCPPDYVSDMLRFLPTFPFLFTFPFALQSLKHSYYLHCKLKRISVTLKTLYILALRARQLFLPGCAHCPLEPQHCLPVPPRYPASSHGFPAPRPFPASDESNPPASLKAELHDHRRVS